MSSVVGYFYPIPRQALLLAEVKRNMSAVPRTLLKAGSHEKMLAFQELKAKGPFDPTSPVT